MPLTPKAFQTLLVLVENQGRLVEKDELLKKVWPDTFVEEATLAQNVFTLRKQLGDDRSDAQYIETVPKRGYRFVAPVRLIGTAQPALPETTEPGLYRRGSVWIAAAVLGATLAVGGFYLARRIDRPRHRAMLAVLPVQNLTGTNDRAYLTDGLTEEIITQLGAMDPSRLGVIARTSSMAYKDTNKTVDQISHELKVDYILEASLRESGTRTRVTAQLIDAGDQGRIWSQDYDAPSGDIVAVEDEIGRAVATQVHLELQPQARQRLDRRRGENPESHDLYLQARYYWNTRTRDGLDKGLNLFYRAAEKDPTNARAFAGVADSYNMMMFYGYSPGAGTLLQAKAAAQKAIELDDSLAEGHAALAYMDFMWLWEWPAAEKEFRRALELNQNYVSAHQWFALYLSAMGRDAEALEQVNAARALDPLSLIVRAAAGMTAYHARKYDEAIAECKSALAVNPDFAPAHTVLGHAYVQKRMFPEASAEYQKVLSLSGGTVPAYLADLGYLYGVSGKPADAMAVLTKLHDLRRQLPFVGFTTEALVYAGLNHKEMAIAYLEKAGEQNDANLIWARSDPRWQMISSDPRLSALLPPATAAHVR
ncbi:MAG: winged helix-turn-helix domain-containing protein [Acidobacteriales bacterium]|nr:winged helix-turn-helix domain-containing protein [Terriglobales bacterium]